MEDKDKIEKALSVALQYGQIDGSHHKTWVIDQMVRILTDSPSHQQTAKSPSGEVYSYEEVGESQEYKDMITNYEDGENGPNTYSWDEGIAP